MKGREWHPRILEHRLRQLVNRRRIGFVQILLELVGLQKQLNEWIELTSEDRHKGTKRSRFNERIDQNAFTDKSFTSVPCTNKDISILDELTR